VGEVGIHLEYEIILSLQRPAKTGDVGGSEPKLLCPMDHMNPGVVGGNAIDDRSRTIWRAIVHYQDLERRILRQNRRDQSCNVEPLVIRRDYD